MKGDRNLGIIRAMTAEDWPYIEVIYNESIENGYSTFRTECPKYEEWDSYMKKDSRLVYEIDGEVVAFSITAKFSVIPAYSGVLESSIYVARKCQGQGIGYTLLMAQAEQTEKLGYWSLYAKVLEVNKASIALHKKCGFRQIGYRERIAKDRFGNWQNLVELERRNSIE